MSHCKATVIKTVWYRHKNRLINQWNRVESPEINLHTYGQLIHDKGGQTTQWRKDSLFNRCARKTTATCKRMKLEHSLPPYTKLNLKWIKDLNARSETIKLLKKICRTLFDMHCSNVFLTQSPHAKETKAKINKWDLIKLKSFCTTKETINKMRRQPTE